MTHRIEIFSWLSYGDKIRWANGVVKYEDFVSKKALVHAFPESTVVVVIFLSGLLN